VDGGRARRQDLFLRESRSKSCIKSLGVWKGVESFHVGLLVREETMASHRRIASPMFG